MDRNSVTGLVLIGLIMIVWLQFMSPERKPQLEPAPPVATKVEELPAATPAPFDAFGSFASAAEGRERLLTVENDLFTATLSSKGATLKSIVLKKHLDGTLEPFNLVGNEKEGALSMLFLTRDGRRIDTRNLYFRTATLDTLRSISGEETFRLTYKVDTAAGQSVAITYLFTGNSYAIGYDIALEGFSGTLAGNEYQLQWDGGIPYTEKNREDESHSALAGAYLGGSLVKLDASKEGQTFREEQSGEAGWVSVRNKYFLTALIPGERTEGIYLEGERRGSNHFEEYVAALKMAVPADAAQSRQGFTIFAGPLDYGVLKAQGVGLEKLMDFGWDWLTRPFAEFIILPVFSWLNSFISNYGLIIIIFAFLIKLVTYPLSTASTKSMKKMAALQPMMKELQEKYKDNPAKLQSELARIYKEAGVNPLGGCLPVVLQMPLLFAMFYVFRSSIQLRQHGFLWINDLSVPDSILDFGFAIPLYGDHIALLPILMAVTVFLQQKITPTAQTNEQMKIMLWMFPAMMLIFFNNLPSGLALYYLMFNVFSVAQQFYINQTTTEADAPVVTMPAPSKPKRKKSGSR